MSREIRNLKDKTFGELTALEYFISKVDGSGKKRYLWRCKCSCGEFCDVRTDYLTKSKINLCCPNCSHKKGVQRRILPNFEALKNKLYEQYKYSAESREYVFSLSFKQFLEIISQKCFYCGSAPRVYRGDKQYCKSDNNYKRNGVDRLDNNCGYNLVNCVPCCTTCNIAKQSMSLKEFTTWIRSVHCNLMIE